MTFYKYPLRKCPGCGNHLTSDRDHCALSNCPDVGKPFCAPPAENFKPAGASAGEDGQGVCILTQTDINLLNTYADQCRHEIVLRDHWWARKKSGPFKDALYAGYASLLESNLQRSRSFLSWGMLLNVGAPAFAGRA